VQQQLTAGQQQLTAVQQQLTAGQQQLTTVQQQLTAVQQQLTAGQQQLTAVQQQTAVLLNRTSAAVVTARLCNSHATQAAHPLTPLPHSDTGAAPPIFPATVNALKRYNNQSCVTLSNFYGIALPAALGDRRTVIARHIGCLTV
jgi:uncharacterized phage infection (PIP) family protein YhgE